MVGPGGRTSRWRISGCVAVTLGLWPCAAHAVPAAPVLQADPAVTGQPPHLVWTPVAGATDYVVSRVDDCVTPDVTSTAALTPELSFVDQFIHLPRQARLPYTVQAEDATGLSPQSNCVLVTADQVQPQLTLNALSRPDGSIGLSWDVDDFTDVTLILRRGAAGAGPPASANQGSPVCATPQTSTGCTDSVVVSGQRYGYSLFAVDQAGNLAAESVSGLSQDTAPPSAPTSVVAIPTNGGFDVSWIAAPDADVAGYRVVYKAGTIPPTSVADGAATCEVSA